MLKKYHKINKTNNDGDSDTNFLIGFVIYEEEKKRWEYIIRSYILKLSNFV